MYVRLYMSAIDPNDVPAFQRVFNEDVRPTLLKHGGCESIELVANVDRNAGGLIEGAAITRWRTLEEMEVALAQREVQESIVRVRQLLRQEPVTKIYEVLDE